MHHISCIQPASCIMYHVSSQHHASVSCIQPALCIMYHASSQHHASCIMYPACIMHHVSCIQPASCIMYHASSQHHASCIMHPASIMHHVSCIQPASCSAQAFGIASQMELWQFCFAVDAWFVRLVSCKMMGVHNFMKNCHIIFVPELRHATNNGCISRSLLSGLKV